MFFGSAPKTVRARPTCPIGRALRMARKKEICLDPPQPRAERGSTGGASACASTTQAPHPQEAWSHPLAKPALPVQQKSPAPMREEENKFNATKRSQKPLSRLPRLPPLCIRLDTVGCSHHQIDRASRASSVGIERLGNARLIQNRTAFDPHWCSGGLSRAPPVAGSGPRLRMSR